MANWKEKFQEEALNALENFMNGVSGDAAGICKDASKCTVSQWQGLQLAKGIAVGAGTAAIPVMSYFTLPADFAITLRIMHRCATGISYIRLQEADEETFAAILGVWSGAIKLDDGLRKQMAAKVLATAGSNIGGQVGLKLSIKAFNLCTSAFAAKKFGPKVGTKVAAKLTAKLTAKATTRWIPIISAIVGGGANAWIVDGVSTAAIQYTDFILKSQ